MIQFPFNILDWRWESFLSKHQNVIKKRKIELHARSIFLQGLLLSNNKKIGIRQIVIKMKKLLFGLKRLLGNLNYQTYVPYVLIMFILLI